MALILLCSRSWSCSSQWDRGPALRARQESCPGLEARRGSLPLGSRSLGAFLRKSEKGSKCSQGARPACPTAPSGGLTEAVAVAALGCGGISLPPARWKALELLGPLPPDFETLLLLPSAGRGRRTGEGRSAGPAGKREGGLGPAPSSTASSARSVFSVFPGGAVVKNPPANARDMGSSPGPGRYHMPWSN